MSWHSTVRPDVGAWALTRATLWVLCETKNVLHFSICACHPCAGAMLIFSVSFQVYRMISEENPAAKFSCDIASALVAQWEKRRAEDPEVLGSSPGPAGSAPQCPDRG